MCRKADDGLDGAGAKPEKKGFFKRLSEGLAKTRKAIMGGLDDIFETYDIDEEFYEEIEEHLVMADCGINVAERIIESLKGKVIDRKINRASECKELLIESMREQMVPAPDAYRFENEKSVLMVIGVNGVGKTTTVGKIAAQLKKAGKNVLLCAADTFRAGAIDQLGEWSKRSGVEMISQSEGSDPAAVVFDAVSAAKSRNTDILIVDTAGRLHNKKNLMDELAKINRVIDREYPGCFRETLVVLDATTGQNALAQAKEFGEAAKITGIILTKLDGTAKGGIAFAIQDAMGIPVKYIGVGEKLEDLQKFDADEYIRAIFE
ncbi:MAG: signal recognition particle-docking protein FtsY [Lachnospiraceae bacterium]|nr:signal recognition particle-docking protein FtsY [Lachnospiraceae bacterium]MBP5184987.1 signal recognition particle-docking protein FtsY [Lachnospiraceae bacterium]